MRAGLDAFRRDRRGADELSIEEHLRVGDVGLDAQRAQLGRALDRRRRSFRGGRRRGATRRARRSRRLGLRLGSTRCRDAVRPAVASPVRHRRRLGTGRSSIPQEDERGETSPDDEREDDDNDENASVHH